MTRTNAIIIYIVLILQSIAVLLLGLRQDDWNNKQDTVINALIEEQERMDYQVMLLRAFKADMLGEDIDSVAFHVQP